jgi:hypothetical protein
LNDPNVKKESAPRPRGALFLWEGSIAGKLGYPLPREGGDGLGGLPDGHVGIVKVQGVQIPVIPYPAVVLDLGEDEGRTRQEL